jgi:hypothetical protein
MDRSGGRSKYENFEKFLFTKSGLRILFDPYEVSCYTEGRRDVLIQVLLLSGI